MRNHPRGILPCAYALALLAPLSGCAPSQPVGDVTQGIAWGTSDDGIDADDQRKRDVSVHMLSPNGKCSATLLTPRIAITASHCLRGYFYGDSHRPFNEDHPTIVVGESVTNAANPQLVADYVTPYINREVNTTTWYEVATDVAVVFLPARDPGSTQPNFADVVITRRPSWDSPETGTAQMAGYATENLDHGRRQFATAILDRTDIRDTRYFELYGAAARPGDSGGSLFITHPDGTRELIGVLADAYQGSHDSSPPT